MPVTIKQQDEALVTTLYLSSNLNAKETWDYYKVVLNIL